MCGRYNFSAEDVAEIHRMTQEIQERLGKKVQRGEVRPTNLAAVILPDDPAAMTWGFPHFKGSGIIINAKSETVHEKRMFKESVLSHRCIVPSTGFYEWSQYDGQQSLYPTERAKNGKIKYLFNLPGQAALYMAGFWNHVKDHEGNEQDRFVILTTASNHSIRDIHDRMPVILRPEEWDAWLADSMDFDKLFRRDDVLLEHVAV